MKNELDPDFVVMGNVMRAMPPMRARRALTRLQTYPRGRGRLGAARIAAFGRRDQARARRGRVPFSFMKGKLGAISGSTSIWRSGHDRLYPASPTT